MSDINVIERSHRFCLKFIQIINNVTRTDVALTLVGGHCIGQDIDYRKLVFFSQLCNLPDIFLAKCIFNVRLKSYIINSYRKRGFIPDIYRLFCRYNLGQCFINYAELNIFPSST